MFLRIIHQRREKKKGIKVSQVLRDVDKLNPGDALKELRPLLSNKYKNFNRDIYLRVAALERQCTDYRGALNTLCQAETIHGEARDIAVSKAEIMMSFPDKSEAISQWEKILKKYQESDLTGVFGRLSQAHNNCGELDTAIYVITQGIDIYPKHCPLWLEKAGLLLQKEEFDEARLCLDQVSLLLGDEAKGNISSKNYHAYKDRKDLLENKISFEQASIINMEAMSRILEGDIDKGRELYKSALACSPIEESKKQWEKVFEALCSFHEGSLSVSPFAADVSDIKKLLVAGTGWSGSGALWDYFREFENTYTILGEHRHIEHPYGFAAFEKSDQVTVKILIEFVNFIASGLAKPESAGQQWAVSLGRQITGKDNPLYPNSILKIIFALSSQKSKAHLLDATNNLINVLIHTYYPSITSSDFAMLDNVIHCWDVQLVKYIENYAYFAVFRDPRTQFVANVLENPGFHKDVEKFIESYKVGREKFKEKSKNLDLGKNILCEVDFEDFILDEEFRTGLSEKLGLNNEKRDKNKYFDPRVSYRNIVLHKTFSDQGAIAKIEKELPQYLKHRIDSLPPQ